MRGMLSSTSRIWISIACTAFVTCVLGALTIHGWGQVREVREEVQVVRANVDTLRWEVRAAQNGVAVVTPRMVTNTLQVQMLRRQVQLLKAARLADRREFETQLQHERNKTAALQRKVGIVK